MTSTDRKIKVCLVGAGVWGRQHARVFSQRPDVELCAVAGRTLAKTQARASEFGLRAYTNLQEMLAAEKPDLVSLSLPNLEHFEATMQVIETGCPLLVEKPLTFELAEANRLLTEAEKRGLFFAINFNHRYAKPLRLAREAIKEGRLGDITHAIWRFGGEANVSPHPYANLIETQCHGFDQAGYFNDFDREFHRTFNMHLDAVVQAFKRGDQSPVHARAGRRALQLAWAAVESFQSGKRVTLAC
jgi:myo-inositol 2-dehydrogenase/D-chiro-inositol 1-dehydrogenase